MDVRDLYLRKYAFELSDLLQNKNVNMFGLGSLGASLGGYAGYNLGDAKNAKRNALIGALLGGALGAGGGYLLSPAQKEETAVREYVSRRMARRGPRDGSGPGIYAESDPASALNVARRAQQIDPRVDPRYPVEQEMERQYRQTGPQDGSGPGVYANKVAAVRRDMLKRAYLLDYIRSNY